MSYSTGSYCPCQKAREGNKGYPDCKGTSETNIFADEMINLCDKYSKTKRVQKGDRVKISIYTNQLRVCIPT